MIKVRGRPKGSLHIIDGVYKRESVTSEELKELFLKATLGSIYKEPDPLDFRVSRDMAILALLALFGKRVGEVARLKMNDVEFTDEHLMVRFSVEKKRTPYIVKKPKSLNNPLVEHVRKFLMIRNECYPESEWLFPSTKLKKKHITPHRIWSIIHTINPNLWPHWFRHSLADLMVQSGEDVIELMDWFDWDDPRVAIQYTRGGAGRRVRRMGKVDYWAKSEGR